MRALELWSRQRPSASALASTEPFCVDTLCLSDWIQWILIPRMHELLDREQPLPGQCNVHAVAEESFRDTQADTRQLLQLIQDFDRTLTVYH